MLLGLTDLVESSEDMRAISSLSVGLKKKNLELYFSESLKSVREYLIFVNIVENMGNLNWCGLILYLKFLEYLMS